jgi:hypothetical protein
MKIEMRLTDDESGREWHYEATRFMGGFIVRKNGKRQAWFLKLNHVTAWIHRDIELDRAEV